MGLKKNLNPLKISEQICQFSLCRDSSVGNIVPCFCFRLSYLYHMESSVSNRFRMVIFSLHCLKEFPNSALKMMTRYIFRNLQTHSRRHAIALRAALTVPSLLPGSDEAPP